MDSSKPSTTSPQSPEDETLKNQTEDMTPTNSSTDESDATDTSDSSDTAVSSDKTTDMSADAPTSDAPDTDMAKIDVSEDDVSNDHDATADSTPDAERATDAESPAETPANADTTAAVPPAPAAPSSSTDAPVMMDGMGAVPAMAPKSKKKTLMMGLVAAGAVLILGGGMAAAYFGYVVPNKPENILKSALANTMGQSVTSEYIDGSVGVTEKQDNQTITATMSGKANNQGAFEASVEADALVTKLTFDMRSVDGTSFYVKVGGLSGLPELLKASGDASAEAYAPLLTSINNQWFEINKSLLSQLGIDFSSTKLSDADRQKLADLYEQHPFLVAQKKLADETIKGMNSYHLQVAVDKAQLKQYIEGVSNANISAFKTSKDGFSMLTKWLDESTVDFSKYPVDLWITKDKKLIDQIKFTASNDEMAINLRVTLFDFNKPVTVEKPVGAKSILDVLGNYYSQNGAAGTDVLEQLQSNGISL